MRRATAALLLGTVLAGVSCEKNRSEGIPPKCEKCVFVQGIEQTIKTGDMEHGILLDSVSTNNTSFLTINGRQYHISEDTLLTWNGYEWMRATSVNVNEYSLALVNASNNENSPDTLSADLCEYYWLI